MEIRYITADLEFDAPTSLDRVVAELEPQVVIHLHDRTGELHSVALGIMVEKSPEESVAHICALLEGLSPPARDAWDQCTRRVVDLAFESGTTPKDVTYTIPAGLVHRLGELGLAIAVTVYRVGFYSGE
ncbi:hypothetical protein [Nannocystis pusilla]|uniref:hypothetical protein n=1 Tax=Nannocystis pusilla TaxID=889268 RepID=UPI003B818439